MDRHADRRYVDHPAPSAWLVMLTMFSVFILILGTSALLKAPGAGTPPAVLTAVWVTLVLAFAVLCFYFWPLYSTYYTLSAEGIRVRYGPWTRLYPWSDFSTAYWQRGLFTTRIGWPSVTPCVRLTDCVGLKRKTRRFGLYLTPNDSRAFLKRIGEFAPELTAEAIV